MGFDPAAGVPQRQVTQDLGIARATVARAAASEGPPKYERRRCGRRTWISSRRCFDWGSRRRICPRRRSPSGRLDRVDHPVRRARSPVAALTSGRSVGPADLAVGEKAQSRFMVAKMIPPGTRRTCCWGDVLLFQQLGASPAQVDPGQRERHRERDHVVARVPSTSPRLRACRLPRIEGSVRTQERVPRDLLYLAARSHRRRLRRQVHGLAQGRQRWVTRAITSCEQFQRPRPAADPHEEVIRDLAYYARVFGLNVRAADAEVSR